MIDLSWLFNKTNAVIWFIGFIFFLIMYLIFIKGKYFSQVEDIMKGEVPLLAGIISSACWFMIIPMTIILLITLPFYLIYAIFKRKN